MVKKCRMQVLRPLCQDVAKKIMEQQNITLSRYKKIYNPEVDYYECGYRAKFKVTHRINLYAKERVDYCCAIHKNQLVGLSLKSGLPLKVEELKNNDYKK